MDQKLEMFKYFISKGLNRLRVNATPRLMQGYTPIYSIALFYSNENAGTRIYEIKVPDISWGVVYDCKGKNNACLIQVIKKSKILEKIKEL